MGITTREFGPNEKGSKLTIAEMDENINYLNDYGAPATTSALFYQFVAFAPLSNRGISAGTIAATQLDTTFV
jgi:hypothetical protein